MDPQKPTDLASDALDEKLRDLRVDEEAGEAARALHPTPPGPASRSLLSLPEKILREICEAVLEEYIDRKRLANYRSDLIRLEKICKLFYTMVPPILYREITTNAPILVTGERFRTIDLEKLVRSPSWQPVVVIDRLLTISQVETLLEHPSVASHVRHISILNTVKSPRYRSSGTTRNLLRGSVAAVRFCLETAQKRFQFCWTDTFHRVHMERVPLWCLQSPVPVLLLLSLAKQVSSAQIYVQMPWRAEHMRQRESDATLTFPSLTSFVFCRPLFGELEHSMTSTPRSINLPRDLQFLEIRFSDALLRKVPNLKTLELRHFGACPTDSICVRLPEKIASLVLDYTFLSLTNLYDIASTSSNLTRLCIYHYEGVHWPCTLIDALAPFGDTLKRLDIDGSPPR